MLWAIFRGEKVQVYKHNNSFWPEGLGFTAEDANGKPGKYFYAGHQFGIEKWETMTGKRVETLNMDTLINDGQHHWVHNYIYAPELNSSFFSDGNFVYRFDHSSNILTKEFVAISNIQKLKYNKAQKILALARLF